MARPKLNHDERRQKIALAACDVIVEVGLERTRLMEIAARAGVTTGAVQHYFSSKEDLLLYVKNHVFDLIFEQSRAVPMDSAGIERLLKIVRCNLPITRENVRANRLLEAFRGRAIGNPALLRLQHKRDRIFLGILKQEFQRLKNAGLAPESLDAGQAALGLNGLIEGLGCVVVSAPEAFKRRQLIAIAEEYVRLLLGRSTTVVPKSAPSKAAR